MAKTFTIKRDPRSELCLRRYRRSSVRSPHKPGSIQQNFIPEIQNCSYRSQNPHQGSQIRQIWRLLRQNSSDDSTDVTEGVTLTPEIFGNKQGATSTPEIFGDKHSFVLTFFATNTIYINCKRYKP